MRVSTIQANDVTKETGESEYFVVAEGPGTEVVVGGGGAGDPVAANTILGNNTGSAAVPTGLTPAQAKAVLAIAQADVANLVSALAGKQAADNRLSILAGLAMQTDRFIIGVADEWASRTPAQARTTLGLVIGTNVQAWHTQLDEISVLTPANDDFLQQKGGVWVGRTVAQVKTDLAITNVDNTSDANKPVSTATQTALDGKQATDGDLTSIAALDSGTAGAIASDGAGWIKKTYAQFKTALGLVKADVGLGSVDNTSDAGKPVSTAQQTALDLKANLASPALTGTPTAPTASAGTDTTQVATTAFVAAAATANDPDVQEFTSDGTWTKPAGAQMVLVEMIGAGGGGCGGPRGAAGTTRIGGGGGQGGGVVKHFFVASDLSATEAVTLGAAGTGGAGSAVDSTDGADGVAGGNTTFGTHLTAFGGKPGTNAGGFIRGSGGGAVTGQTASELITGYGGSANPTFGTTTPTAVGQAGVCGGGGAGANISSANVEGGGSPGGPGLGASTGGAGGAVNAAGGAGGSGTKMKGGAGGGGGGSRDNGGGAAGAGGAGGSPGGGGGGGGASLNGQSGGAGGAGGTAYVRVTSFR